ncbi:MAG: ATP-binding protein, partial [Pirellulaceae bacterium]|nr:ATP-binding protein [Pirellulaceae bacterium]
MNIGPDETLDDSVHILVIEDDREYFATVYAILSGINWTRYAIRWAPDYLSALDELKSGRHDVCLLNMRFGDFDGPSIIEYADEQGLATPIILLARADEIVRSTFGAVEWLHSDEIDSELLEQTIRFSVYRGRTQKTLAQHRSAMDSAIDGLAILDKSGYVSSANKQIAATYLFEDSTELDGVELSALFAGEYSRKLARSALAEAGRAGRWSGEAIGMRRDGETFPKEFSISSIGQGRYVLAERDVSESHNLKEQLFKSQRVEGIGQLTGGIIHDFNNLLSAVLGYSQLGLLKLPEHHPLRAYFEEIEKAAERATLLTQQVRSFTSGEDCQAQTVGLNQVIADLETMLARVIPENVASSTELAENLRYVSINRGQLEQVILNLTINAADAMPSGGSLILKTQNVTVDEHTTERSPELEMGGYVFLAVSDTGEGIPEQVVDRIFEPFFTTKASDKGTGLGLSICHGIVTRAGGT